jgi:hypothetical protein
LYFTHNVANLGPHLGWILGRIVAQCEVILSRFGGWRNLELGDYQELGNLLKIEWRRYVVKSMRQVNHLHAIQ